MIESDFLLQWEAFRQGSDPTAFDRLFAILLEPVSHTLRQKFPYASEEDREDAILQAFFELAKSPSSYDSGKASLYTFLVMVAERRMTDITRKRKREEKIISVPQDSVAVDLHSANNYRGMQEISSVPGAMDTQAEAFRRLLGSEDHEISQPVRNWLSRVLPDSRDQELFLCTCRGQVSAEEFARIYDCSDLSLAEKQVGLKRNRDRVTKKVERNKMELKAVLQARYED